MPDLDLLQSGPDWNLRPVSANINGPQLFSSERGGMGGAKDTGTDRCSKSESFEIRSGASD